MSPAELDELKLADSRAIAVLVDDVAGGAHQRSTRAEPPRRRRSTSVSVAIDVSPGVVIASAPWATPYASAVSVSLPASSP